MRIAHYEISIWLLRLDADQRIFFKLNLFYIKISCTFAITNQLKQNKMAQIKTVKQIEALQKGYRVESIQNQINTGLCWHLEGSVGRFATNMLESGICMLPVESKRDYYGNLIPSRTMLKAGTKGTFQNACDFWQKVQDGDFDAIYYLESLFGADQENEVA